MAKLAELRKKAKGLGISPSEIRGATTASELQEVIDNFSSNGKSAAAKAKAKKKAKAEVSGRKPGRKAARSKSAPAATKSTKGKAKRPTAAKRTTTTKRKSVSDAGRNLLDDVDFSEDDGWNPREGSAPDRIVRALRKFRGNRDKVFDLLVKDIGDFVGARKQDGSKRSKPDREAMLVYRISRTAWEFAVRTGQHDPSENRAEYGTAGTGAGVFKKAKKGRKATQPARKPQKRAQSARGGKKRSAAKRTGGKRKAARR